MLAQADFVAIVTPLTDQTHHLIGEAELRAMKPSAYLINISRGPIIQEAALVQALRERTARSGQPAVDAAQHDHHAALRWRRP
jgi:gluconate 2-dehydrogenase